jgi:hypothetical protein
MDYALQCTINDLGSMKGGLENSKQILLLKFVDETPIV